MKENNVCNKYEMKYNIGDILFNKITKDFWVVRNCNALDKQKYNIKSDYCFVLYDDKSIMCEDITNQDNYDIFIRANSWKYIYYKIYLKKMARGFHKQEQINTKLKQYSDNDKILEVLKHIETTGYHIKNSRFSNSYFMFESKDTTICEFEIKEIPGFLFGIWDITRYDNYEYQIEKYGKGNTWADDLDISPKSELIFFTQYKRDIDKFKPSRSGFVTGLYRETRIECKTNIVTWNYDDLYVVLEYMKRHHIRSVEYAGTQQRYIWEVRKSYLSMLISFYVDWCYQIKNDIKSYLRFIRYKYLAVKLAKKLKCFNSIVIDRGENWYPRIELSLRRKHIIDLQDLEIEQCTIDDFERKYHIGISIYQYDIDVLNNNLTAEQLKCDAELLDKFNSFVQSEIDSKNNILYTNVNK